MRLGGYVKAPYDGPEQWAREVVRLGFRATPSPIDYRADEITVAAYREAASKADIVIAEVGAWGNPLSQDDAVRKEAIAYAQRQLELADRIDARVCVNITGSRSSQWDGPHPDNFSDDTFALIVDSVREIIDGAKPTRSYYALETMPWAFPDSADSYLRLIRAIDRPRLAVHFDPVNMISSPRAFYRNGDMIRDFVAKLGPYVRNGHAKDIAIGGKLTVHLSETIPGTGQLDYATFLTELNKLDPDLTLIIEHLDGEEDYVQAYAYIKSVADKLNVPI
jgi:sugar phosphate isomerase/epimerase